MTEKDDDQIVITISDDLFWKDVSATEIMDGCTILMRGRRFTIREIMAAFLIEVAQDITIEAIDYLRADRLVNGYNWFACEDEPGAAE